MLALCEDLLASHLHQQLVLFAFPSLSVLEGVEFRLLFAPCVPWMGRVVGLLSMCLSVFLTAFFVGPTRVDYAVGFEVLAVTSHSSRSAYGSVCSRLEPISQS